MTETDELVTHTAPARRTAALLLSGALAAATLASVPFGAAAADPPPPAVAPGGDYLIGATYFGGWHSGDNFHFDYKNGQDWRPDHPEREPRYGWYDDTQEVMDAQISDAAANGLDYFSFDWYAERPSHNDGGELGGLHNGMNLFRTSDERDRMSYLINYINASAFSISSQRTPEMTQAQYETMRDAEWDLLTTQWVELFQDPEYLKVDGKPLIEIYDVQRFTSDFSTGTRPDWSPHDLAQNPEERAVQHAAIQVLKDKAAAVGFPDVLIGGGLQQPGFSGEYVNAHDYDGMYDWFSAYGWHDMKRVPDPDNNYYNLIRDNHDYVWDYYAHYKNPAVDYVPLVTSGWDDVVNPQYNKWSIDKTPAAFGDYLLELKSYLDAHPQTNLAPGNEVRMAKIGSWNELFEGHSIVPTKAEGAAYVAEVAKTFGTTDPGATTSARADELAGALSALVAQVGNDPAASASARIQVRALANMVLNRLADADDRLALAIAATAVHVLEYLIGDDARFSPISASWSAFTAAAIGSRVTVGADDYSVTTGQTVGLRFDAVAGGVVEDVEWTLRHPGTWPGADVPAEGEHVTSSLVVPEGVGDGVLYHVSDHLPGIGSTTGNRQHLSVDYSMTVDGVPVAGTVPLTLTVVPPVAGRATATTQQDGTDIAVVLHNQSHETITGALSVDADPGVTVGALTPEVSIEPGERYRTTVEAANSTAGDLSARFAFTYGDTTLDVGSAIVTPVETSYPTTGALDGAVRSDGLVEVANGNGRLQVGNVSRTADGSGGNTEYRIVMSFPLDQIEGDPVRGVLELTEFEAGSPPALTLERIAPRTDITAAAFGQQALASLPFPIAGSPPAEGVSRRIDVTPWLIEARAAGDSHLTLRIRMDAQVPGQTQYRTFRPAEYTPANGADAPSLKVVAGQD